MVPEGKKLFKKSQIGSIPNDWVFEELKKHGKIIMGQSPESKFYNCKGEGMVFLQGIRTFGDLFPKYDTWTSKVTKIANKTSVLLSVRAPVGEVNLADRGVCIGRGLMSIDGKNNLFIFYLFKAFKEYVVCRETGTVYGSVTRDDVAELNFPFPNEKEQEAITKILFDIDCKIELNQQQNGSLEAIGQAIFKRWFIDFEFPNEEGKPYRSAGGEMVDSEIGEIPRGWIISCLDQLHHKNENCVITGPFGSNLHASDYRESGTPLILVKHVKAGRISGESMPLVGNHKFPEMNRYILKIGDIVFTRVAVVGESAYIRKRNENWMISGQMLRVRANKNRLNPRYLAQVFQQKIFKDQVSNYAVGSTRPSLNTKLLLSFKFVLPPLILQESYSFLLENADALIENNLNQMDTLSSIRDLLLPKLMSGKIRVPIIEENVEAK